MISVIRSTWKKILVLQEAVKNIDESAVRQINPGMFVFSIFFLYSKAKSSV